MYVFVERPFIQSSTYRQASFPRTIIQFWSVILILVAVTHATFLSRGFAWRIPADQEELARLQDFPSARDVVRHNGPVAVALVGDSHAEQYQAGLSVLLDRLGGNMEVLSGPGCPILYGVSLTTHPSRQACIASRDRALEHIQQTSVPIIFSQFWGSYDDSWIDYEPGEGNGLATKSKGTYNKLERALEGTMEKLIAGGRRVLLIGSQVDANCHFDRSRMHQGPLPHTSLPPCAPGKKETAEKSGVQMNEMLARIQSKWPANIQILRPVDYLCDSECPTMKDGLWLYFDRTHFSVAGSYYMVRRTEKLFTQFIDFR